MKPKVVFILCAYAISLLLIGLNLKYQVSQIDIVEKEVVVIGKHIIQDQPILATKIIKPTVGYLDDPVSISFYSDVKIGDHLTITPSLENTVYNLQMAAGVLPAGIVTVLTIVFILIVI